MIDTLLKNIERFKQPELWEKLSLKEKGYLVMTLHRPANVDEAEKFKALLDAIVAGSNGVPLIFPVHPRTKNIIQSMGVNLDDIPNLHLTEPMGYLEFNYLVKNALAVITDSGGITEETTVLGIPCMTLRDNTERPETCEIGTNELIGTKPDAVGPALDKLFKGNWKKGSIPEKWDGKAAERIVDELLKLS